ncbi:hypothetical protein MTO96_011003 [Rhipicephalus appendiculatus]
MPTTTRRKRKTALAHTDRAKRFDEEAFSGARLLSDARRSEIAPASSSFQGNRRLLLTAINNDDVESNASNDHSCERQPAERITRDAPARPPMLGAWQRDDGASPRNPLVGLESHFAQTLAS